MMAASIVVMLPLLIVVFSVKGYFIHGVAITGTRGQVEERRRELS
jgi:ABC-type glycerol-3-phosphate transport system permease component